MQETMNTNILNQRKMSSTTMYSQDIESEQKLDNTNCYLQQRGLKFQKMKQVAQLEAEL